ncbi:hypothetical protein [Roseinatronobacter alkalisoli]|uniref:DUF4760 domain-containing protein n=1 Tax=Roseinatronobacter alkalisoli TaxID=3028235 RepID=A0ABT5T5V6_9RHOB|nr:hypothetical protein [Roseinatronobacter sp. HJB301]MDD7970493.1 hypothetical protein [Roseinatronobacter sp. HJB301]
MTFWASLTLGLIAAIVGTYFQHSLWKQKRREEIREYELKEVIELVGKISELFGKRVYAQREFFEKVDANLASQVDYEKASNAVGEWINNFYFIRAQLKRYFGKEISRFFEYELHKSLHDAFAFTKRTHKYGFENLSTNDKQEHEKVSSLHLIAARQISQMLNEINERIDISDFGTEKQTNNIEIGHLPRLETVFLIQRLLNTR